MQISTKAWKRYIEKLSAINSEAGKQMQEYVQKNGFGNTIAIISMANKLSQKYGEAAASVTCEMYDAIASAQRAGVASADPANVMSYEEIKKEMADPIARKSESDVSGSVTRIVKMASADTMLQNAKRDGAEFAWIPSGDSCAFCRILASNGWRRASASTVKGNHADHIHKNCKCEFAVRFDGKSGVSGYDPVEYTDEYNSAKGGSWKDKMNSMRREDYSQNKDQINQQKRGAYADCTEKKK